MAAQSRRRSDENMSNKFSEREEAERKVFNFPTLVNINEIIFSRLKHWKSGNLIL